jgi:O-antigen/teichoic acid export membrane protein
LERAVSNSSIMVVSQLITWTATLVLTAALGRYLGDAGFGELYLAMSFGVIFSVLVEFGLDQQLVRAVARDRSLAGTYLVHSAAIKMVLSVLAYAIILVLIQVLEYPTEHKLTIAVYCLVLLFNGLSGSLTAVYQASERVFHSAVGTIIEKGFIAVAALAMLSAGVGVTLIAAVFVAGSLLSVLWKGLFLRRMVRLPVAFEIATMQKLVMGALPFFLYWALGAVYYRIDVVLLSKLTDAAVVGWYGAAYRLFDTLVFLPSTVSTVIMFPILARLAVGSRADLRLAMNKGLDVIVMLGVPICTGLFILAEPIIQFIYGKPEFLNAVPVLRYLAVGLFLLYVNSVLAVALVSLNQERKMTVVAGLATVINLGLNWLLIPHFQHLAAAAVTVATELFILCYLGVFIPKDLLTRASLGVFLKASVAASVMALTLHALEGHSILLLVPVGGLAYGVSGLILRLVPPEDVRMFRDAVVARRRARAAPATT